MRDDRQTDRRALSRSLTSILKGELAMIDGSSHNWALRSDVSNKARRFPRFLLIKLLEFSADVPITDLNVASGRGHTSPRPRLQFVHVMYGLIKRMRERCLPGSLPPPP